MLAQGRRQTPARQPGQPRHLPSAQPKVQPALDAVFVFCNRGRNKLKALLWRRNGFWLCYRRLERERFAWPSAVPGEVAVTLTARELRWLLDGLDWRRIEGHREARFDLF